MIDCHSHNLEASEALIAVSPRRVLEGVSVPESSRLAVGLHPWYLADDYRDALESLERAAGLLEVAAIGETGLDTLRGPAMEVQTEVLRRHIALAERLHKPLIIHCVRAYNQLINVWRETAPHDVAAVVHGFRGNGNVARVLLEAGFFLSYGRHFNAAALSQTPVERTLAETDDAPIDIQTVIAALAAARGTSPAALAASLATNLSNILA